MAEQDESRGLLTVVAGRPGLSAVMLGLVVLGIAGSVVFLPGEWPVGKRIVLGVLFGLGLGITILASRMLNPGD